MYRSYTMKHMKQAEARMGSRERKSEGRQLWEQLLSNAAQLYNRKFK